MGLGAPAISTNQKKEAPNGPPFAANAAANGLSVDPGTGSIVLGVSDGSGSVAADLLDSRQINMHDNLVTWVMDDGNSRVLLIMAAPGLSVQNDLTAPVPAQFAAYDLSTLGGTGLLRGSLRLYQNGNVTFYAFDGNAVPTGNSFFNWVLDTVSGGPQEFMKLTPNGSLLVTATGADNGRSLQVGGQMSLQTDVTFNVNFPNTPAQSSSDLSSALFIGALPGDVVLLGVDPASVLPNSCFTAWVSAADTVTVRFNNYSAAAQDPPVGNFKVSVIKMT